MSNTLKSVSIAQLTEACKRQHVGFSTGHQDFRCSSCWLFCLDHFQCILISSEYIHISYSLLILQYLAKIHFTLWHLRKFEALFFVFLLLILSKFFATFNHSCIRLTTAVELNRLFVLAVLWRPSSDKDALWEELSHPYTGSLKESILWVQNNCREGTFSSATAV